MLRTRQDYVAVLPDSGIVTFVHDKVSPCSGHATNGFSRQCAFGQRFGQLVAPSLSKTKFWHLPLSHKL